MINERDDFARQQGGFTILEIIISISILLFLTFAVASLLRSNIEMRFALAERTALTHRTSLAMQKLVQDIQQGFIISPKDQLRNPGTRQNNGMFRVDVGGDADQLWVSTMSKIPRVANGHESDSTFVYYKIEEDPDNIGRKRLRRGETRRIPDDLQEEVPTEVLAHNIKSFRVRGWRGDDWSKETWDTTRGETRGRMPIMVSIELEAYESNPVMAAGRDAAEEPTTKFRTVVIVPTGFANEELRPGSTNIKWSAW